MLILSVSSVLSTPSNTCAIEPDVWLKLPSVVCIESRADDILLIMPSTCGTICEVYVALSDDAVVERADITLLSVSSEFCVFPDKSTDCVLSIMLFVCSLTSSILEISVPTCVSSVSGFILLILSSRVSILPFNASADCLIFFTSLCNVFTSCDRFASVICFDISSIELFTFANADVISALKLSKDCLVDCRSFLLSSSLSVPFASLSCPSFSASPVSLDTCDNALFPSINVSIMASYCVRLSDTASSLPVICPTASFSFMSSDITFVSLNTCSASTFKNCLLMLDLTALAALSVIFVATAFFLSLR